MLEHQNQYEINSAYCKSLTFFRCMHLIGIKRMLLSHLTQSNQSGHLLLN